MDDTSGETGTPLSRLQAGSIVRHVDGDVKILHRRKDALDQHPGWWLTAGSGGGGLSDEALTSGDWLFVSDSVADLVLRFNRAVLSDIEARNPGIDLDDVEEHRRFLSVIRRDAVHDAEDSRGEDR